MPKLTKEFKKHLKNLSKEERIAFAIQLMVSGSSFQGEFTIINIR